MAWPIIALGVVQAGIGIYQAIKNSKNKAPIDQVGDLGDDGTAAKYERAFRELADTLPEKERALVNTEIDRNTANSNAIINNVFSDPVTRFKAGAVQSANADIDKAKAFFQSEAGRADLLDKAGKYGLAQEEIKRQVFNSMIALKTRQQELYNERQAAWGEMAAAGISNIVGGLDTSNTLKVGETGTAKTETAKTETGSDNNAFKTSQTNTEKWSSASTYEEYKQLGGPLSKEKWMKIYEPYN